MDFYNSDNCFLEFAQELDSLNDCNYCPAFERACSSAYSTCKCRCEDCMYWVKAKDKVKREYKNLIKAFKGVSPSTGAREFDTFEEFDAAYDKAYEEFNHCPIHGTKASSAIASHRCGCDACLHWHRVTIGYSRKNQEFWKLRIAKRKEALGICEEDDNLSNSTGYARGCRCESCAAWGKEESAKKAAALKEKYHSDPEYRNYMREKQNLRNQDPVVQEEKRKKAKEYYLNNREKCIARASLNSARRREADEEFWKTMTREEHQQVYDLFAFRHPTIEVHVDHIFPVSKGGSNHPDNLAVITAADNLYKRDKHPLDCDLNIVPLAGSYLFDPLTRNH